MADKEELQVLRNGFLGMIGWAAAHGFGDELPADLRAIAVGALEALPGNPTLRELVFPAIQALHDSPSDTDNPRSRA
ncbi:hypothetical protein [Paraburkholderia sp. UCT31]|uniref:hypothetical protein n=1 Tax=Paraburkholderia sp. UCT31 TaxID=2615209 RepID=UPI0016563AF2|nr:hypothetical protein [Paraburkholderia sp. UCT31]